MAKLEFELRDVEGTKRLINDGLVLELRDGRFIWRKNPWSNWIISENRPNDCEEHKPEEQEFNVREYLERIIADADCAADAIAAARELRKWKGG